MRTLDSQKTGDFALSKSGVDVCRRTRGLQVLWVRGDHVLDEVKHFQGVAEPVVWVEILWSWICPEEGRAGGPYRPKGGAEMTLS